MKSTPTASYSVTLRVEYPQQAGSLGKILTTIGEAEGDVGAIDIVRMEGRQSVRDITVNARDSEHGSQICDAVDALPEVQVLNFSDRTFLSHRGGKIEVKPKMSLQTRDALSMAYTPGVARVCQAIAENPRQAFNLTVKRNTIAVVSDGTDTEDIITTIKTIAPGFGGINLEDSSSPRCFEIEERLPKELNIPVFHD